MNRRALLRTLLLAGLALAAPAASAEELTRREAWRLQGLQAAWKRADAADRPLLLIVIPANRKKQQLRSQAWGDLFDRGSDEVIAALSLAEVATATEDDLRRLLPDYRSRSPIPALIRVDAAAVPATWRAWSARLRLEPRWSERRERQEWRNPERIHEAIAARIAALTAIVMEAVAPDPAALAGAMAEDALAQRREAPIPGARWRYQRLGAVGYYKEPDPLALRPEPNVRPDLDPDAWSSSGSLCGFCGMGHTPARSKRFLDFLVEEPE